VSNRTDGSDNGYAKGWDLIRWKWFLSPPLWFTVPVVVFFLLLGAFILATGILALYDYLVPVWISEPPPPSAFGDPATRLQGRLIVVGALMTTPFLVWRLIVWHWAARAAQEQARAAQRQAEIAIETARNALFTKAVDQLGAVRELTVATVVNDASGEESTNYTNTTRPNIEIRLGAIYALEKLARDDLTIHWPIMETLCAYVRENAGPPLALEKPIRDFLSQITPPSDGSSIIKYEEFFHEHSRFKVTCRYSSCNNSYRKEKSAAKRL